MATDKEGAAPSPLWCSSRLTLSVLGFLGFINLYAQRVNLSVAMVCMVNQTYVTSLTSHAHTPTTVHNVSHSNTSLTVVLEALDTGGGCGVEGSAAAAGNRSRSNGIEDGEFQWPKEIQGLVLGSFFWGYLLTQVPGGWLASRYGGKRVLGYCMCACSVLTLLMPLAARADYRVLMVMRILAGVCQGVVWPAMALLWAGWAPPLEMGKLAGFCYAGSQIGNVLTFPIAGLLCEYGFDGGWPSIFYVLGVYGLLWFVLWMFLVFDSPACHPRITPQERHYIQTCLRDRTSAGTLRNKDIPWRKILTSKAVWAIVLSHMCANWGTYTFLTNIPTYMKEVLKFDIKQNGLLSSLPYIGFWAAINVSGNLFDWLQSRGWLSTTAARKISNTLGELCPALLVIGVGFVDCSQPVLGVALLTVGVAMCGFQYGAGFIVNNGDIAPRFAGIIFGLSNTFATIPGFLAPTAIGIITRNQTQEQWRIVFFISAAIYLVGTVIFLLFGSGELQSWARLQDSSQDHPQLEVKDGAAMLEVGGAAAGQGKESSDGLLTSAADADDEVTSKMK